MELGGQAGSTFEHFSHPPVELVSFPYRPDGQVSQRTDGRTDLSRMLNSAVRNCGCCDSAATQPARRVLRASESLAA